MKPLNGSKTHPLSEHARMMLKRIENGPLPGNSINPGVANRLMRESLVEEVELPSPFKSHKGGLCRFYVITDAGRAVLKA